MKLNCQFGSEDISQEMTTVSMLGRVRVWEGWGTLAGYSQLVLKERPFSLYLST